ncbi:hypothetical protein HOLleu_40231 [Holothuria leucospilota]|uniref:Apple domain-containing protein n=1 Tax=Holothuria leucospilota TaxID=206669 RepID=A0A9Q1BCN7_HOLLE|nr:hypothetical protein HOLleu_40231 [Holothuria leucospilota]
MCSSEDLPNVTNGSFNCGDRMMVGEVCNLTCRENYYPSLLSQTTCMNVGTGVGKWSHVTELVCSGRVHNFSSFNRMKLKMIDQSKCHGQNLDAVCKITCSPGLYPDCSDATVCRSVDGKKAEWMVENVHECKDYWNETIVACIRGYNGRVITDTNNIEICKDLCMQEQSFICLSVDFGSNGCYLNSRNRHNINSRDDFSVPCHAYGYVYAERIDIAAWSSEVNTSENGLGYLWSGSLINLDSCKLICSQTIGCCSLMFKNGTCHLNNYKRTPSNGKPWIYTERIDKFCPIK